MNRNWDQDVQALRSELDAMHQAREAALRQCRALIQTCSKCIRTVHRRQFEDARTLLAHAVQQSRDARISLEPHPELFYAGYLQDAEKELVEAAAILKWTDPATKNSNFSRDELLVGAASYLNGMAEAASECRRFLLDDLRLGNFDEAERLLGIMETTYDDLITFDYPDALTGGLRRTCDALRAVIERTRSDLTMTRVQHALMLELQKAQKKFEPK